MRLPVFLALLALPALVRAQAPGVVEPQRVDDRYAVDKYINLDECDPARNVRVEFRWNVQLESGQAARNGVFRFFATNKQPAASSGGLAYCPIADDRPNGVFGKQVGTDFVNNGGLTTGNGVVTTSQIVAVSYPDDLCTVRGDVPIYVCVHFHPYTSGTAVDPTPRGLASGTLTLSTQAPGAPHLDSVGRGNERLEARWTAASTGISAEWFRIFATEVGATAPTTSDDALGSRGWVDGLVNGTPYDVTVVALSAAGNPSPASNAIQESPIAADDFWDRYEKAGGQEQGGCASGAGG